MNGKPLLELENVTKVFNVGGGLGLVGAREIKAVDDISFTLSQHKPAIQALVGESGSGKTTIARMILGLLSPTSGQILYKGTDIYSLLRGDWRKYRKEVQPIFQDPYSIYNPTYKVDRVLKMVIRKFNLAEKRQVRKTIEEALKDIGLRPADVLGRYPHQLSGGERQRLMLARILLLKPKLIIADEPVSMIDVSLRAMFLDSLIRLKKKMDSSCIYITHDLNIAHYVSDKIMVLTLGEIVESGETNSIVREPLHPYTQVLVNSIPIPDPDKRWKDTLEVKEAFLREVKEENQCIHYRRCPFAMQMCKEKKPLLMSVGKNRKVACFLYKEEK